MGCNNEIQEANGKLGFIREPELYKEYGFKGRTYVVESKQGDKVICLRDDSAQCHLAKHYQ